MGSNWREEKWRDQLAKDIDLHGGGTRSEGASLKNPTKFYCSFCRMDVIPNIVMQKNGRKRFFCPRCGGDVNVSAKSRGYDPDMGGTTRIRRRK